VSLDYYLSGVKTDPSHIGCIHNLAVCAFYIRKYAKAEKWFRLALKIDS
jgi:tetratricopeptide (TPR) repeat protein